MIDRLLRVIEAADLDLTAEELADAIWLARVLPRRALPATSTHVDSDSRLDATGEQPRSDTSSRETPVPARPPASTSSPAATVVLPDEPRLSTSAVPLRVPAATALPHSLELSRALRPLHRRVASRTVQVLDEAASAEQIAETRVWTPFLRPGMTRWLDLALVVDASPSMTLWRQTVAEFRNLLMFQGAFRNVRTWHLHAGEGRPSLMAGLATGGKPLAVSDPRVLNDPGGRRMVVVVSDCVSPQWYTGEVAGLLASWGRTMPLVVVQVLPEQHWGRTALRNGVALLLESLQRGAPNSQLRVTRLSRRARRPAVAGPIFPVVTLEKASLGAWASLVAGESTSVLGFELHRARTPPSPLAGEGAPQSALERVQRFHATASPPARKLAGLLAAVPVSLPVMRLVRETMVPEARQEHLAEVFLGGLLREQPGQSPSLNPEEVQYDFWPGVRELLLDAVPVGSARTVLLRVSDFIESRLGQARDFPALLVDSTKDAAAFAERHRGFATIASHVLQRMGGAYAEFAQRLAPRPPETRHGSVRVEFHPAYQGLEARILDTAGQVVATSRLGEAPWLLELPYGRYTVELPQVLWRWELELNESSTSHRLDWALSGRRVLIAGTSRYELSMLEAWMSEALGDFLARTGHKLITRGQHGVDHVCARAYVARLRASGISRFDSLLQVVMHPARPDFDEGNVIQVYRPGTQLDEALSHADAVVFIGGRKGTLEVYQRARAAGKLVLPLWATGGAAAEAFEQLWDASGQGVRSKLAPLRAQFRSAADASTQAGHVIAYLQADMIERPTNPWAGFPERVAERLRGLSSEYEQIREKHPPGPERTGLMNILVGLVLKEGAANGLVLTDEFARALEGAGAGDRIVVLGLLLAQREPRPFEVLHGILAQSLTPFEQYNALQVAGEMLPFLGAEQLERLQGTLLELQATNALDINKDSTRAAQLKEYLAKIGRMRGAGSSAASEASFPAEPAKTRRASESHEAEELIRIVRAQLTTVEYEVVNALPGLLVGQTFKQSHFEDDEPEGTISTIGQVISHVNVASLQRMGALAATLTATCFLVDAAVELSSPDAPQPTAATRNLVVPVSVLLEFEPHDDAPASLSGVFVDEVMSIEVVDSPEPLGGEVLEASDELQGEETDEDEAEQQEAFSLPPEANRELRDALLSAFKTSGDLARMVRFELGEDDAFLPQPAPLIDTVAYLIDWARAQGRLTALVTSAIQTNPGNPQLREFVAQWLPPSAQEPGSSHSPESRLASRALKVFIAYSHRDEALRAMLEVHLRTLIRKGIITAWSDSKIDMGQLWSDAVLSELKSADIILLLVTPDFLGSEFCYSVEMALVLERQSRGEALVIPIILRPCDWIQAPFSKLQALPRDGKPVTMWANLDEPFVSITLGIQAAVANWKHPP